MQFRADDLIQVLKFLKPVVPKRASLEALRCVKIELSGSYGASVTATNLETYATYYIPLTANDPERDALIVNHDELLSVLHKGSYVNLKRVEDGIEVSQNVPPTTIVLKEFEQDTFPVHPETKGHQLMMMLSAQDVRSISERVVPFAAKDEARPVLQGMNIFYDKETESPFIAAADGFRLSIHRLTVAKVDPFEPLIVNRNMTQVIPKKTRTLLFHWDPQGKNEFLHVDGPVIGTGKREYEASFLFRKIDGNFPDVRRIVPSDDKLTTILYVDKDMVMHAAKQKDRETLIFRDTSAYLSATTNANMESNLIEYSNTVEFVPRFEAQPDLACTQFALYPKYVAECLPLAVGDYFKIEIGGSNMGCVIRDHTTTFVIMPRVVGPYEPEEVEKKAA